MRLRRHLSPREESAMTNGRKTAAGLAFAAALSLAGCQHTGSYDLPAEFIPEPAGTRQAVILGMQETRAERTDFVVYDYEWVPGAVVLGDFGQRHVAALAPRMPVEPFPVLVQTSGDANLDKARREALVEYFLLQGVQDADAAVVVGKAPVQGMTGEAAVEAARKGL